MNKVLSLHRMHELWRVMPDTTASGLHGRTSASVQSEGMNLAMTAVRRITDWRLYIVLTGAGKARTLGPWLCQEASSSRLHPIMAD